MDEIIRAGEQLDAANLTAIAFHEPKKLRGEFQRLRARAIALDSPAQAQADVDALKAKAQAMVDRMTKAGVLADVEVSDGR